MRPGWAEGDDPIALRSLVMVWFFRCVMERQMRSAFRALRLARPGLPTLPAGRPIIVYSNHPSWWDPAFAMVLTTRLFPKHESYAPIHAAMLQRYRFFRRIGIFGVDLDGRMGGVRFLQTSMRILEDPRRMLWVTAQGRFMDPRERPLALRSGVAHLMARLPDAVALPLALEYPFWSERHPEALACFGDPVVGDGDAGAWASRLEAALEATCDRLAELAQARDPAAFQMVMPGRAGVGGVYGSWLRLRSLLKGQRHVPDHLADGS